MHPPNIPVLPLNQFNFDFAVTEPIRLPIYAGSAWRGAFGNALKKTVCVVKQTACPACMLRESCAYSSVFETPPPLGAEKMRKYEAIPHPFVINTPIELERNTPTYTLGVTLFGHSRRFFPYILHAFEKAGHMGIGGRQQVFRLQQVRTATPQGNNDILYEGKTLQPLPAPYIITYPSIPDSVEIVLRTPLRIKQQGKNVHQSRLQFAPFFGNLLRRISMLTYFHTDTPLQTDFAGLMRQAENISSHEAQLRWFDWTRYSSRQQTEMTMGGLLGSFKLSGVELEPFWPYLWLGQWTHAGKGTTMGMGAYTINSGKLAD